jgi:threonine dehydrogenase-like Zn-dependent dehydrogenase
VDRAIDAVGVDAEHPHHGPGAKKAAKQKAEHKREVKEVAPKQKPRGDTWQPGDAPSQALQWAVEALAKAGTLSIIGVYPQTSKVFPIGAAMNKNLTVKMGNCNHRKYIPKLLSLVRNGSVDLERFLTQHEQLISVLDAYKAFDERQPGWLKVHLVPSPVERANGGAVEPTLQ